MIELSVIFFIIISLVYGLEEYRIKQLKKQYGSLLKTLEKQIGKNEAEVLETQHNPLDALCTCRDCWSKLAK